VLALVLVILFGPKRIYSTVERVVLVLVATVIVGMLIVAFRVGTLADLGSMAKAIANFGHIRLDDEFTFMRFFGAFVFAGAGGVSNLFYAYYLRDKGIGMGKRIPVLLNPLREAERGSSDIGYIYPDDETNAERFRDWFKYVLLDTSLYFWLLNTLTMFLFMFGALVVLFPTGTVPEESRIIWDLALILESTMGPWGRYLFLIIGIAALFSTQLALTDGGVRLWVDLLHTNFAFARRYAANRLYLWFAIGLSGIGVGSTWFFETFNVSVLDFFFLSAVIAGFSMAAYVPLMLYMNLKVLPKSARPRALNIVMVGIGGAVYISFAVYTVWFKVSSWF